MRIKQLIFKTLFSGNSRAVFLCLCFFLAPKLHYAQDSSAALIIKIKRIDTVTLWDAKRISKYDSLAQKPENVQVVYFKLLEKSGTAKHKARNIIVTGMVESDHICRYHFKVGTRYRLLIRQARYNADIAKKQFRHWHYITDCWNMPTEITR